jgi:aminopeptidase N
MKTTLFYFLIAASLFMNIALNAQEKISKSSLFPISKDHFMKRTQRLHQSVIENNYDLKYHRFYWFIDPAQRYISGSVTSYFTATSEQMNSIQFELSNALTIDSVIYAGSKTTISHPDSIVNITLNPPVLHGQLDSVTLFYHGVPPSTGFGSFENYVHNGAPSMWTLSEPYGASDWWPSKNDLTDKIDSIDVFVVMPNGNHVASNGILVSEEPYDANSTIAHWKHRYPIASYLIAVAVTNYARYSDYYINGKDSLEILNYVYPEDSLAIRPATADVVKAIALFEHFFTPYPFRNEKYGHAECNMGGGMEHQTMTFLGRNVFDFYTINHELGHQWFGDMVTCGSWEDIWLNEGFATFSMLLCYQYLLADDYWYKIVLQEMRKFIITTPQGSVFCNDTTSVPRIFNSSLSYFKGAYLLQMLRLKLGDNDFFQGIRNYLNDPALKYSFARTADLKRHLELQSGTDLTRFFDEWFYGTGVPNYSINVQQQLNLSTIVTINQTAFNSNVSFFDMVLPIKFKGAGKDTTINFNHTFSGQTFEIEPTFKIDSVFFDLDKKILYNTVNISLNQIPSTLNQVKTSENIQIITNPAKGLLKLTCKSDTINYLQIISLDGNTKTTIPVKQEVSFIEIDIHNLQAGMYILKAENLHWIETKKFIVIK